MKMNNELKEYLNDKILMTEEVLGTNLTEKEKKGIVNNFLNKFRSFCNECNISFEDKMNNIDFIVVFDELIDFNMEKAKELVENY